MPNQITSIISISELFTCMKFLCYLKKQTRTMSLFSKMCQNFKNEDFKNVTHFFITFIILFNFGPQLSQKRIFLWSFTYYDVKFVKIPSSNPEKFYNAETFRACSQISAPFLRFCANWPFVKFLAIPCYCKIGWS